MQLSHEQKQVTESCGMSITDYSVIVLDYLLTVCPGRLGPDVVPPGAGVFPEVSVRRRQVGLRLTHGQVGVLPGIGLLHHLAVVLGLEPDHHHHQHHHHYRPNN